VVDRGLVVWAGLLQCRGLERGLEDPCVQGRPRGPHRSPHSHWRSQVLANRGHGRPLLCANLAPLFLKHTSMKLSHINEHAVVEWDQHTAMESSAAALGTRSNLVSTHTILVLV
jgi:hypothetical protein